MGKNRENEDEERTVVVAEVVTVEVGVVEGFKVGLSYHLEEWELRGEG
jgi:hypothetical protein